MMGGGSCDTRPPPFYEQEFPEKEETMRWVRYPGIASLGLVAYSLRLQAPFTADDHFIFLKLQQGGAFGFASQPPSMFFRPLISLHYYLDYVLWGVYPLLSHFVNLLWHTLCGILVWRLTYRLLIRWGWTPFQAEPAAYWGAVLFMILPANVEAVAWFAARADMVATAGTLGALILLEQFQKRGQALLYWSAILCFAGGLFCKESLLTFPLIAWLWLRYLKVPSGGRLTLPFWAVWLFYLVLRTWATQGLGAYPEAWETLTRPWMLVVNGVAYLLQMGMPAILYGLGRDRWDTLIWGVWGLGVLSALYGWRRWDREKPAPPIDWRLLASIVLLAIVPVIIFKPSPFYFLNSRYTYLASAFGVVGVGAWLYLASRRGVWVRTGLAIVLLTYYGGALRQVDAWREAGHIARTSLMSLRDTPPDTTLLILSLPDHFHGAYIWRAGFHEAVALLLPERAQQPVYVMSRFTMRLRTDIAVRFTEGVATLSSQQDIFLPPEGVRTPPGDEVIVMPDKLIVPLAVQRQGMVLRYEDEKFIPAFGY